LARFWSRRGGPERIDPSLLPQIEEVESGQSKSTTTRESIPGALRVASISGPKRPWHGMDPRTGA